MKFRSLVFLTPLALSAAEPPAATELGEMLVEAMKGSPTGFDRLDAADARDFVRRDLGEALDTLPGVSLTRTGARAESGITLRGFDLRQVPVFIDGVPVYVPYDGYPDLSRFSVPANSELEVARGISPVLAGPNILGGLVNIVTRRPVERLEGEIHAGAFTGRGEEAGIDVGGREEKFYWQFDLSWLKQDAIRLSDDYQPHPNEDGNYRENSRREDWRASGRVAWTPSPTDEYVLGFWFQRGEKGNPPYAGDDPTIRTRFWQWPQWDKTTLYTLSRTDLGHDTMLETRLHYDTFENTLKAYDNSDYSSQNLPSSFTSIYDDYTAGGSAMIENRSFPNTRLAGAFHYKLDHHEERNLGFPTYDFEDETASAGVEAEHEFPTKTTLVAGISHDWREVKEAVDTNTGAELGGGKASSWNPQIVVKQDFGNEWQGHAGIARKSRFPTIKDRYSYRLGQAVPNPDLEAETANHFDIGLGGNADGGRFQWQSGLFYARVDDAIQRVDGVAFTPSGGSLFQLRNVGRIDRKGAELTVDARWTEQIETGVRYAWIQSENVTNPEIPVTGTPKHDLLLFAKLQPHEQIKIIPSFAWSSSRITSTTGYGVGTYASLDVRAEVELPRDVTLAFGATNLLDRDQELDEGYPEPGRGLFIDLRYEF